MGHGESEGALVGVRRDLEQEEKHGQKLLLSLRLLPAPDSYILSLLTLYVFSAATPWEAMRQFRWPPQRVCPVPGGQGRREHQALGQVTPPWFRGWRAAVTAWMDPGKVPGSEPWETDLLTPSPEGV